MAPGVEKVGAGGWSQLPLKHPGCVGESRCLPENPELLTKRRERRAGKLQTAMSLCRTVSGVPNPEMPESFFSLPILLPQTVHPIPM